MSTQTTTDICCLKLEPSVWDNQMHTWNQKLFIKDRVRTFFNIPINFGQVMKRLDQQATSAGASIPEGLCLSDHSSKWNMNIYLAIDKEIPGHATTHLTGKFFSRVYEGPFQDTGKWCKDNELAVKDKGLNLKKWYIWYTTCPKCARKYGKNYVVIFSELE